MIVYSGSVKIQRWSKNKLIYEKLRQKNPSFAWKFVHSSNIGGDISNQIYLKDTFLLIKMTSFSLYFFQKLCLNTDVNFDGAYISSM